MQFKIPKFGFKSKKRGNAAGFFGAKLSFISNHLSIISNKLSQNNHLSIINDKLSKKRINYKLSIFGKKLIINYKLLIAVGVLALAATGGTLALNGFFGGGAAIPEDTMTRGLVGYWSFDEGDGAIARDASGNNNHGTLTNGPQWTKGKNSGALQFDGKDDYVDCGNDASLNIANEMTIDMWVNVAKVGSSSGYDSIIGKFESNDYRRWYIQARATSYFGFYGRNDPGAYASPYNIGSFNFGEWTKLTLVLVKGVSTKAYVNGVQTYSGGCENYDLGNDGNLVIGGYAIPGALIPFHGQIDEVRIYNRALTEAEVKYHYNRGGPVAQWDMDEGSGSMINDKSGNGNDGTLVNGPTWVQGKQGTALSFDGTDDYVSVPNSSDLDITADESFSYNLWLKTTSTGCASCHFLIKYGSDGYSLHINSGGIRALVNDSDEQILSPSYQINDGIWHYVEVVFDRSTDYMTLYVDGTSRSRTNVATIGSLSNPQPLYLMHFSTIYFAGQIDEVKIYDYARTEEEIRLDYNAGLATHLGPSGKTCSEDPAGCMDFGLAGHWDMDEGNGSILNDKSGNNNHGTLTNGPKWTQGKSGGALQFDGKDDYVDCGNNSSLNITDNITLEAWVFMDYTSGKNSDLGFISKENSYLLYDTWGESRVMSAFWIDGTWRHSISTDVNSNQWYHLVTTYSSLDRTIRFYIDGNEVAPVVLSGLSTYSLNISANNVHLGRGTLGKKNRVDEARIYNRVLTAEEVRYHYNHGGPVAHWDMDEGEGTRAFDSSGNNNHGTISGATWTQGKYGSALSFDGADDYAQATVAGTKTAYSLWVKNGSVWEHIVNNNGTYYVNGARGTPTTYPIYVSGNTVQLGKSGASTFVNCQIDDVKIYNYARTAEQIRMDYQQGVATHLK